MAIDFETADYKRDSACALALVRVENNLIVKRECYFIKPPHPNFEFTYIHGITWNQVKDEPTFSQLWPKIKPCFDDVEFIVAHNVGFDKSVLKACCNIAGIEFPDKPFKCTMNLSRKLWNIRPTKLPDVCNNFGIALNHHDPASDAEACAKIMIEVLKELNSR